VNAEQASKRSMCRPTRPPNRGRLIRSGETSEDDARPKNAATGRSYSGINTLILWVAVAERAFTSQHWLTFRQALKIGAHVKKGEKGTTVVYADRFIPYHERTRALEAGDEPEAIPFLKRPKRIDFRVGILIPPSVGMPRRD
jgi:antirestriction protein ArdC